MRNNPGSSVWVVHHLLGHALQIFQGSTRRGRKYVEKAETEVTYRNTDGRRVVRVYIGYHGTQEDVISLQGVRVLACETLPFFSGSLQLSLHRRNTKTRALKFIFAIENAIAYPRLENKTRNFATIFFPELQQF